MGKSTKINTKSLAKSKFIKKGFSKGDYSFFFKNISTSRKINICFPIIKLESGEIKPLVPMVRNDGKVSTPMFSLYDQINNTNSQQYALAHNRILSREMQEVSVENIQVPIPHSHFCMVCKLKFDDYYTHIKQKNHTQKMRSSNFTSQINKLCQIYFQQRKKDEELQNTLAAFQNNYFIEKQTQNEEMKQEFSKNKGEVEEDDKIFQVLF